VVKFGLIFHYCPSLGNVRGDFAFVTEEFVGVSYGIYFALLIRLPRARTVE
jgi:hypothetical protein